MLSSPAEDPSLFIKARQGSGEALGAVFERYAGRLHALIRLRLGPGLRRRVELLAPLREHVAEYERVGRVLTPPGDLRPGQRLLHYRIVEKLGEGGMGQVYAAHDLKLDRRVALKTLRPEMAANREWLERFRREAKAVAALNHPSIVTIHSVEEAEGLHFLIMELVEGTSLDRRVGEDGMPLTELFDLAIPIAGALAAAHERGVVHRDLKPGNVMVTEGEQVKILDFGLAKLVPATGQASRSPPATLTGEGRILGTLTYMSPEQIQGQPVDARTDIFSLGIVLYRMATGRLPFHGQNMPALMSSLLRDTPPPVTALNPEVPDRLARVVERCLEKDPRRRWQSALDLASELRDLRQEVESGETPASSVTAATPRPRGARRWLLLAAAALLVATLLTLAVVFLPRAWQQPGEGATADSDPHSVPELTAIELYERGLKALERFDKTGNLDLAIDSFQRMRAKNPDSAAAHARLAEAYWRQYASESWDRSWLDLALPAARRAVELDEHLAASHVSLGLVLSALGQIEEALREFDSANVLDPSAAATFYGVAIIHDSEGQVEEAEIAYRKAIELAPDNREYHDLLGYLLYRKARYAEAEACFQKSIELAPDGVYGLRNLAAVHHAQGRFAEAAELLQKAIAYEPKPSLYSNLGVYLFYQGLYQESVSAFEKSVSIGSGANNYLLWGNLADAYRRTPGNEEKARDAYMTAIRLLRPEVEAKPADLDLRSRLAGYLAKKGDQADALNEMENIEISQKTNSSVLARLVTAYEVCGERGVALEALREALRAGVPVESFHKEPELRALRADPDYQKLINAIETEIAVGNSG